MSLSFITTLTKRFLATDDAARALQLSGIIRFTCIFLQGIILVKAGLPLKTVGQVELIFFIANFFLFFWQNGSNNAMMSWASGQDRSKVAGAIFGGMHIHALFAVVLLWVVLQFPFMMRFDFLNSNQSVAALLIYIFFSIPSGALIYAYLIRSRYSGILWFTGFSQITQVAIVTVTMIGGYDLQVMLQALAGYAILRWLFVLLSGRWFTEGKVRISVMWAFVAFALPLVIHAFNSGIMDYADGWLVSMFFGEESFALYRYGARELPFNALLIGGLMSGMVHRFQSAEVVDTQHLRIETLRVMKLLFPINGLLILLSVPIYTLVYNDDFVFSARIFNIYALTLLSRVIMNQVYCYVFHHNWILTWSTAAEVVLNVIFSLVLMQWLGLYGIPLATVIAYGLQKMFLVLYIRRKFGIAFSAYVPMKESIWYFSAMILCVMIAELIYF